MKTAEEISVMPIGEVRLDFEALMAAIVTEYGDDEEEQVEEEVTDAK